MLPISAVEAMTLYPCSIWPAVISARLDTCGTASFTYGQFWAI